MINVVWSQIGATFLAKFDRFEALVADCYQNEKLSITREEVVAMFQQLLPAAAPGTVAGTGRSSASVSWRVGLLCGRGVWRTACPLIKVSQRLFSHIRFPSLCYALRHLQVSVESSRNR